MAGSTRLGSSRRPNRQQITKQELKFVATAATLLGYYTFVWLPFVLYTFLAIINKDKINHYVR